MNKDDQCLVRKAVIYLFLGVLAVSSMTLAQRSRREDIGGQTRTSEKDLQKEKMRQEASQSFPELNTALTAILEKVSKNQQPQPNTIEQARQLLDDNKRNGWAYDEPQKATYMLLQAWTGFYQDDPVDSVNWSMKAAKTDASNGDVWISQAVFCMLNGKRPLQPRIQKPEPQRRNDTGYGSGTRRPRQRRGEEMSLSETSTTPTQPYGQKGVLEFDMSLLRSEMLKKRFDRREYQSVDGSKIDYEPGQDTLCILFWQADEKASGANESESAGEDLGMMDFGAAPQGQMKSDVENQRKYIKQLSQACKDKEQIIFLQINTDRFDTATKAAQELANDPQIEGAGALVFAAEPSSGAQDCIGIKAAKPFMLIVAKEGTVKYAGPAADFMPAFILTQLTGVEIDLAKQNQTAEKHQDVSPEMDPLMMEIMMEMSGHPVRSAKSVVDPNKPVADPNKPVIDPNAVTIQQPGTSQFPKTSTQQTEQELFTEVQAGKDLEYAEFYIDAARKRIQTYKKGVELCRAIIKEYPGTKYEQEARLLLRRVPEHKHSTYNITDEELGL